MLKAHAGVIGGPCPPPGAQDLSRRGWTFQDVRELDLRVAFHLAVRAASAPAILGVPAPSGRRRLGRNASGPAPLERAWAQVLLGLNGDGEPLLRMAPLLADPTRAARWYAPMGPGRALLAVQAGIAPEDAAAQVAAGTWDDAAVTMLLALQAPTATPNPPLFLAT